MSSETSMDMPDSYLINKLTETEGLLRKMEYLSMDLRGFLMEQTQSEYLSDHLRELYSDRMRELNKFERILYGIDVEYEVPSMLIRIPAIMPHRIAKPDLIYMDTLTTALEKYKETCCEAYKEFFDSIQDGVSVFVCMSYASRHMVRDVDNVNIKKIIDSLVLCGYLCCDEGTYMSLHLNAHLEKPGVNETKIYIMPKKDTISFLKKYPILI